MTLKCARQTRASGACFQPPASPGKPRRRVGAHVKTAIHRQVEGQGWIACVRLEPEPVASSDIVDNDVASIGESLIDADPPWKRWQDAAEIADRGEHNAAEKIRPPECRAVAGTSVRRNRESTAPIAWAHPLQPHGGDYPLPATALRTTGFAEEAPARSPPSRAGFSLHTRVRVRQVSAP